MSVSQTQFSAGLLNADIPAPVGLENPDGAQASKRYDVYRNNVAVGLSDALEAAFPVVRKLVGDEFFRAMAGVYLRKHPPQNPLMMFYGEQMPKFLMRFEPAFSLPYLPDVARLELAMRQAYHAGDAAPIDADALVALAPDRLMATMVDLSPAVHVIKSSHPIASIYLANTQANAPKPLRGPECALITRKGFDPTVRAITQSAADFILGLQSGKSLGVAMATAGRDLNLGETIQILLSQHAISDIN